MIDRKSQWNLWLINYIFNLQDIFSGEKPRTTLINFYSNSTRYTELRRWQVPTNLILRYQNSNKRKNKSSNVFNLWDTIVIKLRMISCLRLNKILFRVKRGLAFFRSNISYFYILGFKILKIWLRNEYTEGNLRKKNHVKTNNKFDIKRFL